MNCHMFKFSTAKTPVVIASEAKQSTAQSNGDNGLLRRFRLRSLSYGGQVAPRNDVAAISGHNLAFSRRDAPELCVIHPSDRPRMADYAALIRPTGCPPVSGAPAPLSPLVD
jgi:hypothetical protein